MAYTRTKGTKKSHYVSYWENIGIWDLVVKDIIGCLITGKSTYAIADMINNTPLYRMGEKKIHGETVASIIKHQEEFKKVPTSKNAMGMMFMAQLANGIYEGDKQAMAYMGKILEEQVKASFKGVVADVEEKKTDEVTTFNFVNTRR